MRTPTRLCLCTLQRRPRCGCRRARTHRGRSPGLSRAWTRLYGSFTSFLLAKLRLQSTKVQRHRPSSAPLGPLRSTDDSPRETGPVAEKVELRTRANMKKFRREGLDERRVNMARTKGRLPVRKRL